MAYSTKLTKVAAVLQTICSLPGKALNIILAIFQPDGTEITQRFDTVAYFTPDLLEYQETLRHVGMRFGRDDSNYIDTFITALIKIKRDSQGALKSATFTSLGCEVYDGEMETLTAFGGCTIKGKTIDAPPFL